MKLVISPTLNERDNIDNLVAGVLQYPDLELLIVDDDSTDGTWQYVSNLRKSNPRLNLLHRLDDKGFRKSYIDGFIWALQRPQYSAVITMDADLSHNPKYLGDIIASLDNDGDLVIGSRYTKGGGVENWPLIRRMISRNANHFARFVTGLPIKDCTAGFNGIQADILRKIDLKQMECEGYGFLIELKYLLWLKKANIVEVPIVFSDRTAGETKFSTSMIGEAIRTCFRVRKLGKP
jgi:dolichol-phosphate mannosyltransferase